MVAEQATQRMYAEGRKRFPSVELSFESFQAYCERVLSTARPGDTERPAVGEVERHGAELFLCCACAEGSERAVKILQHEARAVARSAIQRVQREPEFVRDALQDLWNKLVVGPESKVREYSGRGSFQAWLGVIAARVALDRLRAERRPPTGRELGLSWIEPMLGPDAQLTRVRYRAPFQRALSRALGALTERERNVLRMHALGSCSIDQIGRAYRVHRATAARWLDRVRSQILQSVREELFRTTGISARDFDSIAASIAAELELELASVSRDTLHTGEFGV
jgi:RNA polymerase sigma-70 factor, ECF subfamily